MYQQLIDDFIRREALPASYRDDTLNWFEPLSRELETRINGAGDLPLYLGINGAQGTGKSTLAKLLRELLQSRGLRIANLSIDDFYLSRAKRRELARQVHPLLTSRGVPGTHDTELALRLFDALGNAGQNDSIRLPAFDKASDDCHPVDLWPKVDGAVDMIILEGWCVGARPQTTTELITALNRLETVDDADGSWRRYVNPRLGDDYQKLFSRLHLLIMLQAPNFEQVFQWRKLQEQKLAEQNSPLASGVMNDAQLDYFIQHFERLTRHCLTTLPARADIVFKLDAGHRVAARN
jgi:D-glycerate 3-kinase